MKMWKALLMLLKKCNQIDPWRFFLNNFIVPLLLLTLWIIAENHNFVTVIPNIRFDAFSVSDPSQTQVSSEAFGKTVHKRVQRHKYRLGNSLLDNCKHI